LAFFVVRKQFSQRFAVPLQKQHGAIPRLPKHWCLSIIGSDFASETLFLLHRRSRFTRPQGYQTMQENGVSFSLADTAAWAPGLDTPEAWSSWAAAPFPLTATDEPGVKQMPPMLRRRAGFLGKMALEVAYRCIDGRADIPVVFCSRHGEVARAVELLTDLVQDAPLSPTAFGLAVHNASAGLFSIARGDRANHIAVAAGPSSVEHAVIEACGLLADGAEQVLLVSYDDRLPPIFADYEDCEEQPHAWAWLMVPAREDAIRLSWRAADEGVGEEQMPGSLQVLRFQLRGDQVLERVAERRRWRWTRHG
jgi:hypothetical protein